MSVLRIVDVPKLFLVPRKQVENNGEKGGVFISKTFLAVTSLSNRRNLNDMMTLCGGIARSC